MGIPAATKKCKTALTFTLCGGLLLAPVDQTQGEEVDFSCMSHRVWDKAHVSDRFSEHDIVLLNECAGPVFWSLCIERVDSWSGEILETHNPVGYVEPGQKARINLQLKRGTKHPSFRNRFQEMYVGSGFGINSTSRPACPASACEAKKRELRAQVRANTLAWEKAERALTARIADQCPTSAWDNATSEECEARVREESQLALSAYPLKDQELHEAMAAIDPDNCQTWGGGLVVN